MIKLYRVFDQEGKDIGVSTSLQEVNQYVSTHPGTASEYYEDVTSHKSTLPRLQEDPPAPKGDFLRQFEVARLKKRIKAFLENRQ